jgi:hypothetical protein
MLLDELMPKYDVVERHQILVDAPPDTVFDALRKADLGSGVMTSTLLKLRALPAILLGILQSPRRAAPRSRGSRQRARGIYLADLTRGGFSVVAERPPEELVIGLLGKFWTPRGGLREKVTAEDFHRGPPAGYALAGWNFTVASRPDGLVTLATETRVLCASDALAQFRAYWLVVRTGSGLIRRSMLRAIRREAERDQL